MATKACLIGGMDTETADDGTIYMALVTIFSTWVCVVNLIVWQVAGAVCRPYLQVGLYNRADGILQMENCKVAGGALQVRICKEAVRNM